RDAAVFALQLLDRIERGHAGQILDRRVESAARNHQQRKAGAVLLVADFDGALFVEWHFVVSLRHAAFILDPSTVALWRRDDETVDRALFRPCFVAPSVVTRTSRKRVATGTFATFAPTPCHRSQTANSTNSKRGFPCASQFSPSSLPRPA